MNRCRCGVMCRVNFCCVIVSMLLIGLLEVLMIMCLCSGWCGRVGCRCRWDCVMMVC